MKQVLTRNVGFKILSLLLAVLLWLIIMNIDDPYITKTIDNIPVIILNENAVEENNKIYEIDTGEVASIKIKGKRSVIDNLKASNFEATADFKEMSMTNAVPIKVSPKTSSNYTEDEIEIIKQTEMMTLSLENSDTQTYRVKVITSGDVADGYYVSETVATPNLIEIRGSEKQISKISEVVVEVDVQGRRSSFQETATPVAYDENGYTVDAEKLNFETKEIQVDVTLLPTKEISLYVTQEGEPMYGYECTNIAYKPDKIVIAGKEEDLEDIYFLKVPFSVEGQKETMISEVSIEEYLDDKYILVDENKSISVTAKIEELNSKDVMIRTSDINIKNLSEDYKAVFVTQGTITLRITGLAEKINHIVAKDLQPYIDLSGYTKGTYYVSVNSNENDDITVRPSTISIEIVDKDN